LRVAIAGAGILRAFAGLRVVASSPLAVIACSRRTFVRSSLATFLGLPGTDAAFLTTLRSLFRSRRALSAAFRRCRTFAGFARPHLFLFVTSCGRLAVRNSRSQQQADHSSRQQQLLAHVDLLQSALR